MTRSSTRHPLRFMHKTAMHNHIPLAALQGSLRDFLAPKGPHLVDRSRVFYEWQDLRRQHGVWPYARSTETAPLAHTTAWSDDGADRIQGINFASQDYLSLSSHPRIKQAAIDAIHAFGTHSAGSAALLGNTANSVQLERALSDFLNGRQVVLYATGWSAGYASVQGFVRPHDHVVIDILAHSCLQEGARASTPNVHLYSHLNVDAVNRKLKNIRERDATAGILVVTESLFSMHSDVPDFQALRLACDTYGATLLVDCAHDLGSMGADGKGNIGQSGMLDQADIIIGSFSKTFASNGGFVSVKDKYAAEYLKYYSASHTFTNALSPAQAAVVSAALEIVCSEEGRVRREKLMDNILYLRSEMEKAGLEVLGEPSPIVPVRLGSELVGRLVARQLSRHGGIANLVEYPAVPRGDSRFRFQVMADHTHGDIDAVVKFLQAAMAAGTQEARACQLDLGTSPGQVQDSMGMDMALSL
jgi:glycine C-acetyltransferase